MPIFIIIEKDLAIRILSQPPRPYLREPGSHCFSCDDSLSIYTLRRFLALAYSSIRRNSLSYIISENFTLVY